jgi:D-amino-acid dehydrogenase
MHVVVVGAGIAGATTALALVRQGCTVSIIEERAAAATGASFANAGLVSPGHCFSWAEPGVVAMATKSLLGLGDGIGISPPWSVAMCRWAALFACEGTRQRWIENSKAALALAAYSRDIQFGAPVIPLDAYGGRLAGILYLYGRDQQPGAHDAALLSDAREEFALLDAAQLLDREPLLHQAKVKFSQAVYCPKDGTGDAARYAKACIDEAVESGAKIFFAERAIRLEIQGDVVLGVTTDRSYHAADAVVVAAGLSSRDLLESLGYRLPIHPVSGYSVTYQVTGGHRPQVGAVSIPHKVAWAAFGDETVRFTGYADIGIPGSAKTKSRFQALESFAADVLPELRALEPSRWVGQRPMTPDNLPFLGAGKHRNLWLNCGHGAMGWTMACGSAQAITDLILGHSPAINLEPYRWNRYGLLSRRASAPPVLAPSY